MATREQVRQLFGILNGLNTGYVFFLLVLLCLSTVSSNEYCNDQFKRCICTDKMVECHNESKLTDITTLYHHIKDHIVNFTITGSKFTEIQTNFLGACERDSSLVLKELINLDLSGNKIERIHGKSFHCMPNLKVLNLSHNDWKIDFHRDQIGYFTSLPGLKTLDLTNAFDEVWNGSIHIPKLASVFENTDMSKLEILKLGYNELYSFSVDAANSFCNLDSLRELDLSHNSLSLPSMPTIGGCLEKLETVDLSHNSIRSLPSEFMQMIENLKGLKSVKLDNNPYVCDCSLRETWQWLDTTDVPVNKDDLRCASGYHSSYINKTILELELSDLQCMQVEEQSNTAVRAVTGVIFTILGITLVVFLFIHRKNVFLLLSSCKEKVRKSRLLPHSGYRSVQEIAFVENV